MQELLGHRDVSTTMIHLHAVDEGVGFRAHWICLWGYRMMAMRRCERAGVPWVVLGVDFRWYSGGERDVSGSDGEDARRQWVTRHPSPPNQVGLFAEAGTALPHAMLGALPELSPSTPEFGGGDVPAISGHAGCIWLLRKWPICVRRPTDFCSMQAFRILLPLAAALAACGPSPVPERQPPGTPSSPFDRSAPVLRLGRDSFAIRFTGAPPGFEVHEYARAGNGYHYATRFSLGPRFHRTVEVALDSSLRVVRASSVTQLGEQRGESDVAYEGQRARGAVVPTAAATVRRIAIDTVLPERAFDGLALYPILLGRRWGVGQSDTLLIFDTDELSVTRQSFRVVALDTVQAAGEQVLALRGELSTTQLPVTLWLSEATPHRLLRIGSANGQTVLVR